MTKLSSRVQATEPIYELHTLGWRAFQQLSISIVSELWGQTVEGYFDSLDGGRDGAFFGTWRSKNGEIFAGAFTVQCKFSAKPDGTLHLADLNDELAKARRLAGRGLADNYFLLSSKRLTGTSTEVIKAAFEAVPGINHCAVYGADRISQFIRESPRLRRLIPHVYGLGDLSQILDERAYAQAQEILSALGDDLAKFVVTDAYRRAKQAIAKHGFVILLGEPACGKSTIAAALALGALDEDGHSTLKVRDADDFVAHSNPHEPKQFFWVDDAFGETQIDWQSTAAWSRSFPHINAAIRRGARVVFTSRDYIFRSAQSMLKNSALPALTESQVVIFVEKLSKREKEQILYNHIRLGTQPKSIKSSLKPHLPAVVVAQGFSPEIARRLGNPAFTKNLDISSSGLASFVSRPMPLLQEVIRTLDVHSRSAIALIFMRGGALLSPVALSNEEEEAVSLLGGSVVEVRNALVALDGSLVTQVQQGGEFSWRFKHPTIRDAFAALVAQNRELMDIYLTGTPAPQLFSEITCGDVGLKGVKVIVPQGRYAAVLRRFEDFIGSKREHRTAAHYFLARRCDKAFLADFFQRNPKFISSLNIGSYLYAVSDVSVVVRLSELGLLPESERARHVSVIRTLAVDTPDAGFLVDDLKDFLTDEERVDILDHVRIHLLPALEMVVESWRDSWDGEEAPESYFDHLRDALNKYKSVFHDDENLIAYIESGLSGIDNAVDEMLREMPGEPDEDRWYGETSTVSEVGSERSTFEDVDQ